MKSLSFAAAFLLCVPAAAASEPRPERISLNASIDFTQQTDMKEIGASGTRIRLLMRQPAFRYGKGPKATYVWDYEGVTKVIGNVQGQGHARIDSDDGSLTESYGKSAEWGKWTAPSKGAFSMTMPEPSHIGDGLRLELSIHAAVEGASRAHISGKGVSADIEPNLAIPYSCHEQSINLPDRSPECGLKVSLDAMPTGPKDPEGAVLYPDLVKALAIPETETALAMTGQVYGATTEYRENGHFTLRFARDYVAQKEGSAIRYQYNLIVWSSAPNDEWKPKDVVTPNQP